VGDVVGEVSGMTGFPIVSGPYPLMFGVGAISRKPGLVEGHIEPRDYLPMSVMFDHDAVDGADTARFLARLGELLVGSALMACDPAERQAFKEGPRAHTRTEPVGPAENGSQTA